MEFMFEGNNGCLSERLRLQHQEKQERTVVTATHVSLPTVPKCPFRMRRDRDTKKKRSQNKVRRVNTGRQTETMEHSETLMRTVHQQGALKEHT